MNKYFYSLVIICLFIWIGYISGSSQGIDWNPMDNLNVSVMQLFLMNLKASLFFAILTFLGPLGMVNIFLFALQIGTVFRKLKYHYGVSTFKLFITGLPHGIFELAVLSMLFSLSLSVSAFWIEYFKGKNNVSPFDFYKSVFFKIRHQMVIVVLFLIVGALLELKISRVLFLNLILRGGNLK